MVRAARDRVSAPFVRGDATALPIATGSVDVVVFVSTLEDIPDIDAVLAEATSILTADWTLVALVLSTRSEYVQSNLEREGSYFQRMVHGNSDTVTETVLEHVDGEREFFLGISEDDVFESTTPTTAALSAIVGPRVSDHNILARVR